MEHILRLHWLYRAWAHGLFWLRGLYHGPDFNQPTPRRWFRHFLARASCRGGSGDLRNTGWLGSLAHAWTCIRGNHAYLRLHLPTARVQPSRYHPWLGGAVLAKSWFWDRLVSLAVLLYRACDSHCCTRGVMVHPQLTVWPLAARYPRRRGPRRRAGCAHGSQQADSVRDFSLLRRHDRRNVRLFSRRGLSSIRLRPRAIHHHRLDGVPRRRWHPLRADNWRFHLRKRSAILQHLRANRVLPNLSRRIILDRNAPATPGHRPLAWQALEGMARPQGCGWHSRGARTAAGCRGERVSWAD